MFPNVLPQKLLFLTYTTCGRWNNMPSIFIPCIFIYKYEWIYGIYEYTKYIHTLACWILKQRALHSQESKCKEVNQALTSPLFLDSPCIRRRFPLEPSALDLLLKSVGSRALAAKGSQLYTFLETLPWTRLVLKGPENDDLASGRGYSLPLMKRSCVSISRSTLYSPMFPSSLEISTLELKRIFYTPLLFSPSHFLWGFWGISWGNSFIRCFLTLTSK